MTPEPPDDLQLRLVELSTLYEAARALIGARDRDQVAARIVLTGMGSLGVRSGALLVDDEHGRFRVLYAAGLDGPPPAETLPVGAAQREWMLREGAFQLSGPRAARALGPLRERLAEGLDAALGAAVSDPHGLLAILLFGPRLLGGDEHDVRGLLDALAARPAPER